MRSAVVAPQGVQKALGGSGMVPDITVESLTWGVLARGKRAWRQGLRSSETFFVCVQRAA